MVHQITLLGGQLLPVYIGILERNPEVVHILYTKETVRLKARLLKQFQGVKIYDYQIDPYEYQSIQEIVTNIICNNENAIFELNLTSGTKLMAFASQQVFNTLDYFSFYIDQKQNIIDLSNGNKEKIKSIISTKTFLSLSDHDTFSALKLKSFSSEEKQLAVSIFELRQSKTGIGNLFKLLRSRVTDQELKYFSINDSLYKVLWKNNHLSVKAPRFNLESKGERAFKILSTGLWWELIIGMAVEKWKSAKEIHMSLAIKSNKKTNLDKNEIDILINTGQNIFFIECKSGFVSQSDINKIRIVSKLYGGIISKSILVSMFKPNFNIIEKCQDLGIELFYLEDTPNKIELNSIVTKLDKLLNRIEI
jgi:hypothetical protein